MDNTINCVSKDYSDDETRNEAKKYNILRAISENELNIDCNITKKTKEKRMSNHFKAESVAKDFKRLTFPNFEENKLLPEAVLIKISDIINYNIKRVKIYASVHRIRYHGKLIFITLKDDTEYIQCVLTGNLCSGCDIHNLKIGCLITVYGTICKTDKVKKGYKLECDFWHLGEIQNNDDLFINVLTKSITNSDIFRFFKI